MDSSLLHSPTLGMLWIVGFALFFLFRLTRGGVSWLGLIFDLVVFGVGLAIIYPTFLPGLVSLLHAADISL